MQIERLGSGPLNRNLWYVILLFDSHFFTLSIFSLPFLDHFISKSYPYFCFPSSASSIIFLLSSLIRSLQGLPQITLLASKSHEFIMSFMVLVTSLLHSGVYFSIALSM